MSDDVRCLDCKFQMVPANTRPIPKGYTSHHGRGLCWVCYIYNTRKGTLQRFPKIGKLIRSPEQCKRGEVTCNFCETVQDLEAIGETPPQWMKRMGYSSAIAMQRRLQRHGKKYLAACLEPEVYAEKRERQRVAA